MNRNFLFGSTCLRSAPDMPSGGAPAPEPETAPAAAQAVDPTPAVQTPEPSAAAPAAADPAPAEQAAPAPPEPAKPDAQAAEPAAAEQNPAEPNSLLGEAVKAAKEAPKPADPAAAKPVDAKPAQQPAEAAPAAPTAPTYNFTMPEGTKVDDKALGAYTEVLGKHNIAPEVGQALLDQHLSAMGNYANHLASEQQRVWQETNARWKEEARGDAEIGGAAFDTSLKAAARMLELVVKPEELNAFNQMLEVTGAGNHPLMLKMMVRFAKWLDEPGAPAVTAQPTKTNGKAPGRKGLRDIYAEGPSALKTT